LRKFNFPALFKHLKFRDARPVLDKHECDIDHWECHFDMELATNKGEESVLVQDAFLIVKLRNEAEIIAMSYNLLPVIEIGKKDENLLDRIETLQTKVITDLQDKNKSLQKTLLNLEKQFSNLRPYLTNEGFKKHIEDLIQKSKASNYGLSYNLPYIRRHSNEQNELYITEPDRVTQKMTYLPDKVSNSILPYYRIIEKETGEENLVSATKYRTQQIKPKQTGILIHIPNTKKAIKYTVNCNYKGKDKFVLEVIKCLNAMYQVPDGKIVLDYFIKTSLNKFDINDSTPLGPQGAQGSLGVLAFVRHGKKIGGVVQAGDILKIQEHTKYGSLAHELYHAYQNDNGIYKKTFSLEIEADLFGTAIQYTVKPFESASFFGDLTTHIGQTYQKIMEQILYFGYKKKDYEKAIMNFAQGSNMNFNNTYVNAGYVQDALPITKKPLIAKFALLV